MAEPGESQSVKVAVNIRPLIEQELQESCQQCVSVAPGEPQVQIYPDKAYTFDHVYGSTGAPQTNLFEDCVLPLVEGLFQGYNATVLAYGQTGSGKTWTMGTAYTTGGNTKGVIPKTMQTIFGKIEEMKKTAKFDVRVSFIEIHMEEIKDLLDGLRLNGSSGVSGQGAAQAKQQPAIRETQNGGVALTGVTEIDVISLEEMAECLEHGSQCRATGSTNMNSKSSRSHAIFTIVLERRRRWDAGIDGAMAGGDEGDFLCAKLHLVDLAGSERAKKTKADGQRLQEGIHINKGLLALGNVISALGDEKMKKEGGFVTYRDSKLTRLLKDSLGGNSRTVMIACISPADINMDETISTLKYANRARNIQNKPIVNRDPVAAELQGLRHQVQMLQAELAYSQAGRESLDIQQHLDDIEAEKEKLKADYHRAATVILAEQDNLRTKLLSAKESASLTDEARKELLTSMQNHLECACKHAEYMLHGSSWTALDNCMEETESLSFNEEQILSGSNLPTSYQSFSPDIFSAEVVETGDSEDAAIAEAEEWDHKGKYLAFQMQHDESQRQLQGLNKRLVEKEARLRDDTHSRTSLERKLREMMAEREALMKDREKLMQDVDYLVHRPDEKSKVLKEKFRTELEALNHQLEQHKKKEAEQRNLLKNKQKVEEKSKKLEEEILRIKQTKAQLQRKMKHDFEQFNAWKNAREKEMMQLRKVGRRTEYDLHKLRTLHERQTLVLQRKTEESAQVQKRLKAALEQGRSNGGNAAAAPAQSISNPSRWLEEELALVVGIREARRAIQHETDRRAALGKEKDALQHEAGSPNISSPRTAFMSPSGLKAKETSLKAAMTECTHNIQTLHSQLAEAEEREHTMESYQGFKSIRGLKEARNLLQLVFSAAAAARIESNCRQQQINDLMEQNQLLQIKLSRLRLKEATSADWSTPIASIVKRGQTPLQWSMDTAVASPRALTDVSIPCPLPLPPRPSDALQNEEASNASDVFEKVSFVKMDEDHDTCQEDPDYTPGQEDDYPRKQRDNWVRPRRNSRLSRISSGKQAGEKANIDSGQLSCSCKGKCSRSCRCKDESAYCGTHCLCKAKSCVNRESPDVDPSAAATAATMELEQAALLIGVGGIASGSEMPHMAMLSEEERKQIASKAFAIHGAHMELALKNGLGLPRIEGLQIDEGNSANGEENSVAKLSRRPLNDIQNKDSFTSGTSKKSARTRRTSSASALPTTHNAEAPVPLSIPTPKIAATASGPAHEGGRFSTGLPPPLEGAMAVADRKPTATANTEVRATPSHVPRRRFSASHAPLNSSTRVSEGPTNRERGMSGKSRGAPSQGPSADKENIRHGG